MSMTSPARSRPGRAATPSPSRHCPRTPSSPACGCWRRMRWTRAARLPPRSNTRGGFGIPGGDAIQRERSAGRRQSADTDGGRHACRCSPPSRPQPRLLAGNVAVVVEYFTGGGQPPASSSSSGGGGPRSGGGCRVSTPALMGGLPSPSRGGRRGVHDSRFFDHRRPARGGGGAGHGFDPVPGGPAAASGARSMP